MDAVANGLSNTDDVGLVRDAYDVLHAARLRSPTLARIWQRHATGVDYPDEFGHFSFLTLADLRRVTTELRVGPNDLVVDVGCGTGGPALWAARETGARLHGVDLAPSAIDLARERAAKLGLMDRASFSVASFDSTGLADAQASAVMSVDALMYAPDKAAALREISRILARGGRLVFTNFELDVERATGRLAYRMDPVGDYRPMLIEAGFAVETYEETPAWKDRLRSTYEAVVASAAALSEEMGDDPFELMRSDLALVVDEGIFARRAFAVATRR